MLLCVCVLSGGYVSRAEINSAESQLIGAASSTFYYNGSYYRVKDTYINQLVNALNTQYDLSQSQANMCIDYIYNNVGAGITAGYLYEVAPVETGTADVGTTKPGQQTPDSSTTKPDQQNADSSTNKPGQQNTNRTPDVVTVGITGKTKEEALREAAEIASDVGVGIQYDEGKDGITITDRTGHVIMTTKGAIKNTGYRLNSIAVFAAGLVVSVLVMACFALFVVQNEKKNKKNNKKKRYKQLCAYIFIPIAYVILGFALLFVAFRPLLTLVSDVFHVVLSGGSPQFESELQSIYDETATPATEGELSIEDIEIPTYETCYARLTCDRLQMDVPVYWGDSNRVFREGAGQYIGSFLPGYGDVILIGAHDALYFAPLEDVKENDTFEIRTNYGIFAYRVTETKIASTADSEVYQNLSGAEQLVLYTCYPFGTLIGVKDKRFYVFADKISGPSLKGGEGQ